MESCSVLLNSFFFGAFLEKVWICSMPGQDQKNTLHTFYVGEVWVRCV